MEFGFVSLKVYDVLGREVAVLVNKEMKPGRYTEKFDGSEYPSGVYFYKLKTQTYSKVRKMILITLIKEYLINIKNILLIFYYYLLLCFFIN